MTPRFQLQRSKRQTPKLKRPPHLAPLLLPERTTHPWPTASIGRSAVLPATERSSPAAASRPEPATSRPARRSFLFNDTATTEIYTHSLHDALPISPTRARERPWGRRQPPARS